MDLIGNLVSINFNFYFRGRKGVTVDIPNRITFKLGKHYFSPESLDAGLPIRIETSSLLTISNVLFCVVEKSEPKYVLYNHALPNILEITGLKIIKIPWKKAFEAASICLTYQRKQQPDDLYYIAIYDQFTEKAYASEKPFVPLFLQACAVECDPELDKEYEKRFGRSFRAIMRAKTPEERQRVLGLTLADFRKIEDYLRRNSLIEKRK